MASAFQPRVLVTVTTSDARTVAVAGRTPVGASLNPKEVSLLQVRVQSRGPVECSVQKVDGGWVCNGAPLGDGVCLAFDPDDGGIYIVNPRRAAQQLESQGLPASALCDAAFMLSVPRHEADWIPVDGKTKPVTAVRDDGSRVAPPGFEPGTS